MKVWITKYALSSGLKEDDSEESMTGQSGPTRYFNVRGYQGLFTRAELAFTLEEAREKAFTMRTKKIASLRKQIAKLEKMTF